jgi:DNA-binding transcriptional ArsR family regulator
MRYVCIMVQVSKRGGNQAGTEPGCSGLAQLLSPRLFKALSDPKRLSLFMRLAEDQGPCTVSQMAQGSGVDFSVVSRHLAILREAGIIKCVKRGKELWCTVEVNAVPKVLRDLADALESCCPEGLGHDGPASAPSDLRVPARKKRVPRIKQSNPA